MVVPVDTESQTPGVPPAREQSWPRELQDRRTPAATGCWKGEPVAQERWPRSEGVWRSTDIVRCSSTEVTTVSAAVGRPSREGAPQARRCRVAEGPVCLENGNEPCQQRERARWGGEDLRAKCRVAGDVPWPTNVGPAHISRGGVQQSHVWGRTLPPLATRRDGATRMGHGERGED